MDPTGSLWTVAPVKMTAAITAGTTTDTLTVCRFYTHAPTSQHSWGQVFHFSISPDGLHAIIREAPGWQMAVKFLSFSTLPTAACYLPSQLLTTDSSVSLFIFGGQVAQWVSKSGVSVTNFTVCG
jgi:hypothetical protein